MNNVHSNIMNNSLTEQEEEMSGWDGAEGGVSNPQSSQSESVQAKDFQFDDGRQEDILGPKFKSLRHLRQVNKCLLCYKHQILFKNMDSAISD